MLVWGPVPGRSAWAPFPRPVRRQGPLKPLSKTYRRLELEWHRMCFRVDCLSFINSREQNIKLSERADSPRWCIASSVQQGRLVRRSVHAPAQQSDPLSSEPFTLSREMTSRARTKESNPACPRPEDAFNPRQPLTFHLRNDNFGNHTLLKPQSGRSTASRCEHEEAKNVKRRGDKNTYFP